MVHLEHSIDIVLGGYYEGNTSWKSRFTQHDNCFKLYYLTEGELFVEDNEQIYRLTKEKFYFINGRNLTRYYCKGSFAVSWLHFIPCNLHLNFYLLQSPTVVELPSRKNPIESIGKLMRPHIASNDNFRMTIALQTNILQAIQYTLEKCTTDQDVLTPKFWLIKPAMDYIAKNFVANPSLNELSQVCNISPGYFHRLFTQIVSITPANYINITKLNNSLTLLKNEKLSIKEIAFQLGFCDNAHFSRLFKNHFGVTPKQYRLKGLVL